MISIITGELGRITKFQAQISEKLKPRERNELMQGITVIKLARIVRRGWNILLTPGT